MSAPDHAPIDERALSKLRWRCRRGLLENDLLLERFFARMGDRISVSQERALLALMDLSDPDLLDLLLARKPPGPEQSSAEILEMLQQLRPTAQQV
ncbi:MAG: succinate dehydrogenase assembly factor 2 [Betaproteobacteria bacterium]|jgi:antitoxin CptB|uniref:FAD assembly factor SdhE n=1 Tax=Serpentinimonas maccroryi TaxID=1458426 RepID=UPI000BC752AA|nr:succinate dehydrogenase assembly factor 2 [Serpentinimonas maccroryi]MCL5968184.1 succinate dehydrogenase assembly factor 2 [Betaproteobacteria bacterium]MCM2479893.1 succinate dehydrogenase assembly factor 2 [Serpentinimonas maccroryi]OYX55927.1 MAG: succinate dehydrogenase assembly factor 2 [Comamonadaceae bacterium 32-67-11]OZA90310.1 MAG: succinate dehydrogenase assembly factor 2 [Burkholderiales bacterium 34-67-9]